MKTKEKKAITIGSVVQLKSGGPKMTVVSAVSNALVILTVLWADKDNRIAKADIALQALKLVK
jgi:hypothetical protein